MLLEKDPCKGCLVEPLGCTRICEKVFEFYKNRVRKRSKAEVELATGYHWEEDYIDKETGEVLHTGGAFGRINVE